MNQTVWIKTRHLNTSSFFFNEFFPTIFRLLELEFDQLKKNWLIEIFSDGLVRLGME